MNDNKITYNKRAIGKSVYVLTKTGFWYGNVIGVKDEETFIVKNSEGKEFPVNIFDIRYP